MLRLGLMKGITVCGWASQPTSARVMGVLLLSILLVVPSTWAVPAPHDGIIVALDGNIQTLNPYSHNHKLNAIIDGLIHDQLFFRDPKTLRPVPNLAESLKAIDDFTWEIKLRPHVRFHNGEPLDAAAVKFTIDYLVQANTKSPHRNAFCLGERGCGPR